MRFVLISMLVYNIKNNLMLIMKERLGTNVTRIENTIPD